MLYDAKLTAALLKKETPLRPRLAMVLGSGFQHALAQLQVAREIAYGQLPGFPTVGVTGHAGKLVLGLFDQTPVLVLKGRAHYYEGIDMERLTFPVRVLAEFGIRALLLTNAAGAVNRLLSLGGFHGAGGPHQFHGGESVARAGLAGLAAIRGLDAGV